MKNPDAFRQNDDKVQEYLEQVRNKLRERVDEFTTYYQKHRVWVPQTIGKAVDPIYEAIGEKRWKLDDEWEKWEQQVQKEEHFSEGTINIALNEARNWLDNDFAPNMRSLEVRVREILGVNEY